MNTQIISGPSIVFCSYYNSVCNVNNNGFIRSHIYGDNAKNYVRIIGYDTDRHS